jgi:HK97 family phage prohead protease
MELDRVTAAFEVKELGGEGHFKGLASAFGPPADLQGDVIERGAFAASLGEHAQRGTAPPMLWQHDPRMPIGRWTQIRETEKGLAVEGKLTLEVQQAREARALLKDGALDGLSIGFRTRESRAEDDAAGRVLTDIELIEISLVTLPANERARVAAVKAAEITTPRAFEEFLREAGFPRAFSKAVTSHGFPAAQRQRDAGERGADTLTAELRRAADTLRTMTKELSDA